MPDPLRNILIANRGEIVLRIIRTAKRLGIAVTGIYSEQDKNTSWIEHCDQSWSLGSGDLNDTYLNIGKIINVALQAGTEAIHPGYGFLSENFRFAEACEQNNIVFIGPSSNVLKIAGNKPACQELALSLGIPVPERISGSVPELISASSKLNMPVLVKAAAGGGGKGIRLARHSGELSHILKTVSDEGLNYFGEGSIYLEQYIPDARHIEVQVLSDKSGYSVHLFERECSVQRRHQKVIEESPANELTEATREALFKDTLKIMKHLGYCGAGTVEFLADTNGNHYFLEINPRIQVEHGITEMLTGIDLVEEQIKIAEGKPLSFRQEDIRITGHALESRIYAEDPENNLLPSPGRIFYFSAPSAKGVRIETAMRSGAEVHQSFDPLVAKLIVHATDRTGAIARMLLALDEIKISGIRHNIPILKLILADKDFISNRISTTWLNENLSRFSQILNEKSSALDPVHKGIAAAIYILNRTDSKADSPWNTGYWRSVKQVRFRINGRTIELDYEPIVNNTVTFYSDSSVYTVHSIHCDDLRVEYVMGDAACRWFVNPESDGSLVLSDGHSEFAVEPFILFHRDYSGDESPHESDGSQVLAPQPGTVLDIKVREGQQVSRGDNLLTIESMKLENTILAVSAGIVKKIRIKAGDRVKKYEPLIYLQETINN